MGNRGSAQSWNGYSYVSNSPMSFVDPSGLSQAPGAGGCDLVGVMCGAAGGGFGLASVVSTHRFLYVDIFISFVSSWFNTPTEPWINYREGGGAADGGWGSYDSHEPFSFGIAIFSAAFQVTSQMAVAGTPDITRRPMGVIRGIRGLLEGTASVLIPGYDLYECYVGEGCTATDIAFGTIEVAVTLTGVGYLARVGIKTILKTAKAAKAVPNPGGRLGSQSTRNHVKRVARRMERRGYEIVRGGGRHSEEYLPGPGGARKGSSFVDITGIKNGRTVRVNTVDTRFDGITPSARELRNAARIRAQTPGDHLVLIPKP